MATKAQPTNAMIPPTSDFDAVLKKYGVTPDNQYVPSAPTIYKSNLRELCNVTTPLMDNQGNAIKKVKGHTGPLMFLAKKDEVTPKESRYSGYDGFYIYAILHPKKGETVITLGRPKGDNESATSARALVEFFDGLQPGAWFQIAEIETGSGFGVYTVVPVQRTV